MATTSSSSSTSIPEPDPSPGTGASPGGKPGASTALGPGLALGRQARWAERAGLAWLAIGLAVGVLLILRAPPAWMVVGDILVVLAFPGYALYLSGVRTWRTLLESLPLFQAWEGAGGVVTLERPQLFGETALVARLSTPGWPVQRRTRLWRATERRPPRLVVDLGDEARLGDANVVPLGPETVAVRPATAAAATTAEGELWLLKRYGKDLTRASHRVRGSKRSVVIEDPGLLLPHELEIFIRALTW